MIICREQSETLSTNKGRVCNNSKIDTLISKRLYVENKAKLSQLTRAEFVTIAKWAKILCLQSSVSDLISRFTMNKLFNVILKLVLVILIKQASKASDISSLFII